MVAMGGKGGTMTVSELRDALTALPGEVEVVVYADWQGAVDQPLAGLDERVYVWGYYALKTLEMEGAQGILLTGERLFF